MFTRYDSQWYSRNEPVDAGLGRGLTTLDMNPGMNQLMLISSSKCVEPGGETMNQLLLLPSTTEPLSRVSPP